MTRVTGAGRRGLVGVAVVLVVLAGTIGVAAASRPGPRTGDRDRDPRRRAGRRPVHRDPAGPVAERVDEHAQDLSAEHGATVLETYDRTIQGFSARISADDAARSRPTPTSRPWSRTATSTRPPPRRPHRRGASIASTSDR